MTERHEHLDEGTIHAWLDGALLPDESARVESRARECAECAALVAEARGLIAASSRILSSLDAVPAGVIPGADAGGDQLARLRARRRETARHWWQDRRIVAAASLVFVAGVSSLVWRSSTNEAVPSRTELAVDSARPAPDQPAITADAPASTSPVLPREASARDTKAEAPPSVEPSRARAAAARPSDSATAQKTVAGNALASGSFARNEARRADTGVVAGRQQLIDSTRTVARLEQRAAAEQQLRQQGAASPRQAVQQLRADTAPPPAAAPAPFAGALRRGPVVTTGVGAAMADVAQVAGNCYRLRIVPPSRRDAAIAIADTVKLLSEMAPVLSDPSLFRTRTFGAVRDTTLVWRSIDAVTVELRGRYGADSVGVRFLTTGAVPDVRAFPDVRAAVGTKVVCPR